MRDKGRLEKLATYQRPSDAARSSVHSPAMATRITLIVLWFLAGWAATGMAVFFTGATTALVPLGAALAAVAASRLDTSPTSTRE